MKKLTIAATITASVLLLSGCSNDKADSEVVVKTDAGNITKADFFNEMNEYIGQDVLYNLVLIKLLEEKYDVSDKEVDQAVQEVKEQQGDMFQYSLMQQGLTEDTFREQTYRRLLQEKFAFEGIKISDEELQKKFDEMKENKEIAIRASHILVEDEAKAKELKKQLDEGADFAKLAKENSTDEGSAANGGDLGYFTAGKMVKEFEDAAFSLKEGEISEPVKSKFGYHIIKVTDVPTFDEKKEEIRKQLASEKIDNEKVQERLNKLIKDADIDVKMDEYKDLFTIPEANTNTNSDKSTDTKTDKEKASDKDTTKSEDNK